MGKLARVVWGITWRTLLFCLVVGLGLWWMNRDTRWDANTALNAADNYATGRAGLVVVGLAQPEQFEPKFFVNFLDKLFTQVIPWPINVLAGADNGIFLMDPNRPYAPERFTPTVLADLYGNTSDIDGVPWIEKYKRGELRWEKPSASSPFDTGYYLYPGRKQGMRGAAAKTSVKARYLYYANLSNGVLPHYRQTVDMGQGAVNLALQRYPFVAGRFADAFDKGQKEAAVRQVLDAGVDSLVLASVQPISSDFEELKGSYADVAKIVARWRKENGDKPVKLVVAPYLATQPQFDELWLRHFEATAPAATGPNQSAVGIISLHGLPVMLIDSDSWSKRTPVVTGRMKPKMEAILRAKGYANVRVEAAAEGFADTLEDPDNKIVSVAELFAQAKRDKAQLAIALPIEFLAENTDTLFAHSAQMFEGLPGYSLYQGPPKDVDWSKPYIRRFVDGPTTIIYAGSPGGAAQALASEALAGAIGQVFRKP
jgi:hypothetical protein